MEVYPFLEACTIPSQGRGRAVVDFQEGHDTTPE
jgi:hypothetical protein